MRKNNGWTPEKRKAQGELMKSLHGDDFYKKIGRKGGLVSCAKGFGTNRELASLAGYKGGKVSKRRSFKHEAK